MCFNANISITTFLLGIAAIIIGIINKTLSYSFSIFYLSVITMQLIEFFIWIYINDKQLNYYLSILASILIILQPFCFIILVYFYNKKLSLVLFTILVFIVMKIMLFNNYNNEIKTIIGKHGSLQWNFLSLSLFDLIIYFITSSITLYYAYDIEKNNKYFKFLLGAFMVLFIIFFIFTFMKYKKINTFASIFCNYINLFSFIIIIVSIYKSYFI
jgi:hypothetical protein